MTNAPATHIYIEGEKKTVRFLVNHPSEGIRVACLGKRVRGDRKSERVGVHSATATLTQSHTDSTVCWLSSSDTHIQHSIHYTH